MRGEKLKIRVRSKPDKYPVANNEGEKEAVGKLLEKGTYENYKRRAVAIRYETFRVSETSSG